MKTQSEETIFIGREEELTQLMAFAKDAFAGKAGVAFVTGEAGIGKTFLVEEFFRQLRKEYEDVVIASGQCTIQSASYLPFQAILEDLLESQKKVKVSGKKFKQVTEVVVDTIWNVGPDLIGVFGIPIKALQTVVDKLGLRGKESAPELEVPKELDQFKIFGWYTKIMKDISEQFPLVLFLDDLHWADDSSLNLLLYLGRETEEQRMLVIGTYRPHEVQPNSLLMQVKAKLGRYGTREFSLDVSEDKAEDVKKTQQFVHAYLLTKYGTNFSDTFEQVLVERTEGNALFLTEILKNLEEKGQIVANISNLSLRGSAKQSRPAWQLTTQIETIADLPEKVENAISERVDRLEETLREILDYASVEGDDFIAQVIAKVRQIQERSLINDLTKKLMKTYQLIWERGGKSLPNGQRIHEFSFKHNLIREYVYAQLSETDKEFIHAEIGECLEKLYEPNPDEIASKLAIHFFHGHVLDKAMHYCLKAAQDANSRYGASEAVRFGKMGLEALEKRKNVLSQEEYAEKKVQFLICLAKAESLGGDSTNEVNHIEQGISYLQNNLSLINSVSDELCSEAYVRLGELYIRKSSHNRVEAGEYLEKALSIYEQHHDDKNAAEVFYLLSDVYPGIPLEDSSQTPYEKGLEALENSLSLAKSMDDIELQARCLTGLASKHRHRNFKYAAQCSSYALKLSKKLEELDRHTEIRSLLGIAGICRAKAENESSTVYLQEALRLSKQIGNIFLETWTLNDLGFNYSDSVTSQEKAILALKEGISLRERLGFRKEAMYANLGGLFARQGKWIVAEEYFHKAVTGDKEIYHVNRRIGHLCIARGLYAQAEERFLQSIEVLKKYNTPIDVLYCIKISLNYSLLGKQEQCREYLANGQGLFEEETRPLFRWRYLYESAEVYRLLGELDIAKSVCQESIDQFLKNADNPEDLLFVAEARLIMGKILVDMGEYRKAITYLDKAKAAFEICGHYALGETLLYLGKAHQGLGGTVFLRQAREYVTNALSEFQRLELAHKEREAKEVLEKL